MKILIVKNRYKKPIKWDKGIQYFHDNTPLKFTTEEISTDFDFEYRSVSNGTGTAGVVVGGDYYEKLRTVVPDGKYDIVVLLHGNKVTIVDGKPGKGSRIKISEKAPMYKNTDVIQMWNGEDYMGVNHEMFHTFTHKLSRKGIIVDDPMDKVVINGKTEYYYNNDSLTAKVSNRTIALDRLKPYWNALQGVSTIVMPKPTTKYKYFKDSEIIGLEPDLVSLLDKCREEAKVPFIITSGRRTKEENDKLPNAVSDSAHLDGVAVDIKCLDSSSRWKIVNAAIKVGFTRIGIGSNFVHLDVDLLKPQNCIWHYY